MGGTWSSFMGATDDSMDDMIEFRDVLDGVEDCNLADEETDLARRALEERLLPRNDHWHSENSVLTATLPSGFKMLYYVYTDWCFRQYVGIASVPELPHYLLKNDLVPSAFTSIKTMFHHGFLTLAMELYRELKPLAQPEIPMTLSGFGGGGAVAAITAALLKAGAFARGAVFLVKGYDADGFNVSEVYTYGQPMFTDARGAALYDASGLRLLRTTLEGDPLPHLPLARDSFAHAGAEILLLDDKRYAYRPRSAAAGKPQAGAQPASPEWAQRAWADLAGPKPKLALFPISEYIRRTRAKLDANIRSPLPSSALGA